MTTIQSKMDWDGRFLHLLVALRTGHRQFVLACVLCFLLVASTLRMYADEVPEHVALVPELIVAAHGFACDRLPLALLLLRLCRRRLPGHFLALIF